MTMHAQPPPPRSLGQRVEALEERAEQQDGDAADLRGQVIAELGAIRTDIAALSNGQQTIKTEVQGVNSRIAVMDIRVAAALDKDRAVTNSEIAGLAKRLRELAQRTADDKREILRQLNDLDDDVEKSGQHGRDTLTSVQIRAEKLEQEQKAALERQEATNRERIATERAERAEAEAAKAATAHAAELAAKNAALALEEARAHAFKMKAFWSAIGAVVVAVGAIIAFLANRALPERSAPAPAPAITVVTPSR